MPSNTALDLKRNIEITKKCQLARMFYSKLSNKSGVYSCLEIITDTAPHQVNNKKR